MAYFFNAEEIFQVGIEIEQNGIKFYQKLIDLSKDPELKKTYAYLRSAEENHVKVFQSLQAKVVSKVIPAEAVKEFPEEDMSYMKTLADANVFSKEIDLDKMTGRIKSAKDAVNLALDFEKASILFYLQMKKFTRPEWGEADINKLIKQEEEHIKILSALLAKLK